jgi:hypothetical protein
MKGVGEVPGSAGDVIAVVAVVTVEGESKGKGKGKGKDEGEDEGENEYGGESVETGGAEGRVHPVRITIAVIISSITITITGTLIGAIAMPCRGAKTPAQVVGRHGSGVWGWCR